MKIFNSLSAEQFLAEYWQKKPLVLRQALSNFRLPLTAEELAGLALEEEVESRLVWRSSMHTHDWQLQRGPFTEEDFKNLPRGPWTLLVQGVDRFVPEVTDFLDYFNFLPQWRVDDIMISYAVKGGGVGPHYDNYDVFLYQAKGKRSWSLTTRDCVQENYLPQLELRIMKNFVVEEHYILEEGDMLYLPSHIGHDGVALSKDCMTYSIGYRSYRAQEFWESYLDYLSQTEHRHVLYQDPLWQLSDKNQLPEAAFQNAWYLFEKTLLSNKIEFKKWFAKFITSLDPQAEFLLEDRQKTYEDFLKKLKKFKIIRRHPACRFAYFYEDDLQLFINGEFWDTKAVKDSFIKMIADERQIEINRLLNELDLEENQLFLFRLWQKNYLEFHK